MRLPWGLGRNGRSAGSGAAAVQRAVSSAPAAASRPSGAWRQLPPIQRTVDGMPLVAAPAAFVDGLPGSRGLPPIVEPLGHELSPLATPGLVVAHARPIETASATAVPAPVQRRARRRGQAPVADPPSPEPEAGEPTAPTPAAPSGLGPASEAPPVRSLTVVARESVRTPDRPLTSAAAAVTSVQRSAAVRSASVVLPSSGPAAAAGAPVMPVTGMRRARAGAALASPLTVSRSSASSGAASPVAAPSVRAVDVESGRQDRRAGLGAPVAELPAGVEAPLMAPPSTEIAAPVQRTAGPAASPAAGRPLVARRAAPGGTPAHPAPGHEAAPGPISAPTIALPVLPLAGAAPRTPTVQRIPGQSSERPAPVMRPTAGRDPLRPRTAVQRAVDDGEIEDDDVTPRPWWQPATEERPSGALPTEASGFAAPGTARSTVSRSASWLDPAPSGPWASGSGGGATPGSPAVQRSLAARPGLPLPRPALPATPHPDAAAQPASPPAGSATAIATAPTATPAVKRSPTPGASAAPLPMMSGTPVVQRVEGSAPAPPTGRGALDAPSERELDELAGALFGRIRNRLRSELIHDREARGLTFDRV